MIPSIVLHGFAAIVTLGLLCSLLLFVGVTFHERLFLLYSFSYRAFCARHFARSYLASGRKYGGSVEASGGLSWRSRNANRLFGLLLGLEVLASRVIFSTTQSLWPGNVFSILLRKRPCWLGCGKGWCSKSLVLRYRPFGSSCH